MSKTDVATIVINSVDRISGSKDDFTIQLNPVITNVKSLRLQSVRFPFNFNNVTTNYGNTFTVHLVTGVNDYLIPIVIPNGFYTTNALLTYINQALIDAFAGFPNVPPGANISPITLTFAAIPNRVLLNYNCTVHSPATLTFVVPADPVVAHVFRMLGLPVDVDTVYAIPATPPFSFQAVFPDPATTNLPISEILIYIEGLPSKVLTSYRQGAQFYVDVQAGVLNGQQVQSPNTYNVNRDYENNIVIVPNYFNFQQVRIWIRDSRGLLLTDQNLTEWSMSMSLDLYHRWENKA